MLTRHLGGTLSYCHEKIPFGVMEGRAYYVSTDKGNICAGPK